MDGATDDIHAIHSCLAMSYLAATGGFVAAVFSDSAVAISTNSDTKCKVQPPSKSPPIIEGPWVAVLPRFQPPVWLLSVGRAAQAISRKAQRTERTGGKKKNLIQNTAKNKLKRGLLDRNYRPSSQASAPALKSCCDFRQKRLLVFIGGNRCWVALNGTVMVGEGGDWREASWPRSPKGPIVLPEGHRGTITSPISWLGPYVFLLNSEAVPRFLVLNSTWHPLFFFFPDTPLNTSILPEGGCTLPSLERHRWKHLRTMLFW